MIGEGNSENPFKISISALSYRLLCLYTSLSFPSSSSGLPPFRSQPARPVQEKLLAARAPMPDESEKLFVSVSRQLTK